MMHAASYIKSNFLIINFNIMEFIYMFYINRIIKYLYNLNLINGDWGLWIGDLAQSPIPNPQSPIPNPHFIILKI